MFIATHKKIAHSAYNLFSPQLKNLINKKAFIEGSYYPDTNFKYTILSHSFEATIGIVNEKIDELLTKKHKRKSLGKKLGIICHFLADYCSPYHVNRKFKDKNIITHLNYERKTNNSTDFIYITDEEMKSKMFLNLNTLEDDLMFFIEAEMQGDKDIHREVKLSVVNSYHIINLIMAEYIKIHIDKNNYIDMQPSLDIPVDYYPSSETIAAAMYDEADYLEAN